MPGLARLALVGGPGGTMRSAAKVVRGVPRRPSIPTSCPSRGRHMVGPGTPPGTSRSLDLTQHHPPRPSESRVFCTFGVLCPPDDRSGHPRNPRSGPESASRTLGIPGFLNFWGTKGSGKVPDFLNFWGTKGQKRHLNRVSCPNRWLLYREQSF